MTIRERILIFLVLCGLTFTVIGVTLAEPSPAERDRCEQVAP